MSKTLFQNALAIVSCDPQDTVYRNCDLMMEGCKIVAMGQNLPIDDCNVIDASQKIIYPGLVNTHHHFFQSFVRNQAVFDGTDLEPMEWLDAIYRIFDQLPEEAMYYTGLISMADLIKHGCTTAFDHQYCYNGQTGKACIDHHMQAAKELGMRLHSGRGCNTLPRSEGSTVPDGMVETTQEFLDDCIRLIDTYHDGREFSMQQIAIAPCQPVNCYEETFVEAVKLAREKGVRLHTHLGEGEGEAMVARYGETTLEWCKRIGFIGEDVWYAHCWFLNDEEFQVLADTKTGISHCASGASLGGFPFLNIEKLQTMGVPLGFGVDGGSTNDGSSLLDAIRVAFMMQSGLKRERGTCCSAYDILKAATVGGAQLLGRSDIGSLEVGKAADFFMIDMNRLDLVGASENAKNLIARVGVTGDVYMTVINGEIVFKDGVLQGIDEEKLAQEATTLWEQFSNTSQAKLNLSK